MKNLTLLICLALCSNQLFSQEFAIGEEVVTPLHYPKFSLTGEYDINRKFHGFADEKLRSDIERRFDGTLSFEAGLAKYFNAGGLFGASINGLGKPITVRLGIFAKPLIPLGERFALFARLTGGLVVDLAVYPTADIYYSSFDKEGSFGRVFKGQKYIGIPFGGFGAGTIGLEVFPFTRFGIAFEFGIRAALFHSMRNMLLAPKTKDVAGAPQSFNYMVYEFPLMLTFHFII